MRFISKYVYIFLFAYEYYLYIFIYIHIYETNLGLKVHGSRVPGPGAPCDQGAQVRFVFAQPRTP